jgi:hypothetical protein
LAGSGSLTLPVRAIQLERRRCWPWICLQVCLGGTTGIHPRLLPMLLMLLMLLVLLMMMAAN